MCHNLLSFPSFSYPDLWALSKKGAVPTSEVGLFSRIVPKEGRFFELFKELSGCIVQGAHEFRDLATHLSESERRARNIKEVEHQGDEITHRTVKLLHETFITPLDREDIHQLVSKMDDILDFIDAAAQRIHLYDVTEIPKEGQELAEICVQAAHLVQSAVGALEDLKNPDNVVKTCVEINRLENDADHVLRSGLARLFKEEPDTRKLIKLKEVYELLETVTDRCEDVANIIEGIVLEYA